MVQAVSIETIEGEDIFLVARPESPSGEVLTAIEISAATISIYDRNDTATALATDTLLVTADPDGTTKQCMFTTLQEDGWWPLGGGYTFWTVVRQALFPLVAGKTYLIEVKLTAGHTANAWPNLDDYGDIVLVWTTTPKGTAG